MSALPIPAFSARLRHAEQVMGTVVSFDAPLSAAGLRQLAPGVHNMDVYLCGPPGMTGTAVTALTQAGVPRSRIHYESFEF